MAGKKIRYDLGELREIPILSVCEYLDLPVEKRGRNFWCKVRNESQASVILHTDTNYFYDFGNEEHGNNIGLVQYAKGIGVGEAIRDLAQAFHILPSETMEDNLSKPLNAWEYKKLGLYGDLATKNLVFPVTTATVDELLDMEYGYRMTMNQLRQKEPDMYRHILETKAMPYVARKRNCFFMSVWNHYCFLQMMNRSVLFFDSERTALKFESEVKDLEQSERALYKACLGTDIAIAEPQHYDPQRVLSRLLQGKLEFSLGTAEPDEIRSFVSEMGWKACEMTVSYDAYCAAPTDDHIHSAVFQKGQVTLLFPESEKAYFNRIFYAFLREKASLDTIVLDAESRRASANSPETKKQLEPVR